MFAFRLKISFSWLCFILIIIIILLSTNINLPLTLKKAFYIFFFLFLPRLPLFRFNSVFSPFFSKYYLQEQKILLIECPASANFARIIVLRVEILGIPNSYVQMFLMILRKRRERKRREKNLYNWIRPKGQESVKFFFGVWFWKGWIYFCKCDRRWNETEKVRTQQFLFRSSSKCPAKALRRCPSALNFQLKRFSSFFFREV